MVVQATLKGPQRKQNIQSQSETLALPHQIKSAILLVIKTLQSHLQSLVPLIGHKRKNRCPLHHSEVLEKYTTTTLLPIILQICQFSGTCLSGAVWRQSPEWLHS